MCSSPMLTMSRPPQLGHIIVRCLAHGVRFDLPYSLIEADALFHNISVEQTLRRYFLAKLREVSREP
jgi:hypothetical protein